jgi:hypothetical protein
MSYTASKRPYPPFIQTISSIKYSIAPSGLFMRVMLGKVVDPDDEGATVSYEAVVSDNESYVLDSSNYVSHNILTIPYNETTIPINPSRGFVNIDNNILSEDYKSDGYLDFTKLDSDFVKWMGKDIYVGIRRVAKYNDTLCYSLPTSYKIYYPHLDEPQYQIVNNVPTYYNPASERVLTMLWTYSTSINNGYVYDNNDSFMEGDILLYFKGMDTVFHTVNYVISFYDHAASPNLASPNNIPYNNSGQPLYFAQEVGSAFLYNPELAGNLFSEEEDSASFLDKYTVIPYTFTDGKHFVGLIGSLTVANNFDGIRFRLHNSNLLTSYKMYLHILIDGHYANTESVLIGRGISPSDDIYLCNGYSINNMIPLNVINPLLVKTAVKFNCNVSLNPNLWTAAPSTQYTKFPNNYYNGDC